MNLRNPNINYSSRWFVVTAQAAHNKTVFGVIAEGRCVLNELGRAVEALWRSEPHYHPEVFTDTFVLMPNHFHAIVKIALGAASKGHGHIGSSSIMGGGHCVPTAPTLDLSGVMRVFKSRAYLPRVHTPRRNT